VCICVGSIASGLEDMQNEANAECGDVLKPSRLRQDFGAAGKAQCGIEPMGNSESIRLE